jgi:hypothetical protein
MPVPGPERLMALLQQFVSASSWAESRRVVEQHRELLTAEADAPLGRVLEQYRNDSRAVQMLTEHRDLLRRCREEGIDTAFEALEQACGSADAASAYLAQLAGGVLHRLEQRQLHSSQAGKLLVQPSGRDTFQQVHRFGRCMTRQTTDTQMDSALLHGQRFYLRMPRSANFSNQVFQPVSYLSARRLSSVARYPDEVVRRSANRMCASSSSHCANQYSMARSRAPLGGPPCLPTPKGGVSKRRIS